MKSIKEKAKENLEQNKDETLCVYDRYAGFVDGANYVLDAVENIMKEVSEVYPKFHQGTIIKGRLKRLIEQLKK